MRNSLISTIAAAILVIAASIVLSAFSQAGLTWHLLTVNVPANVQTQIQLQLVDGAGKPFARTVTLLSSRIDMGPDNMPTMTAPLRTLPSKEPGTIAFETNLYAPGRWALSLSAKVDGVSKPVTGRVVIAAGERRAEAPPAKGPRRILYYRNSMGLPDTSPVPKKDAMGMDYIPVYSDEVFATPGTFRLTTEKIQRAGVRTEVVRRMQLTNAVRATGTVAADESKQAVLTTKFDGFIEKLFVSTTGAQVRKGQAVARVWLQTPDVVTRMGPDVVTRQIDYIVALQDKNQAAMDQAVRNLRNYGIPDSAIAEIRRSGRATRSITLSAPLNGTVLEKAVVEGMHFNAGDALFKTADLSTVWVLAQVSERDLPGLRPGQTAKITFRDDPGASFDGKVSFIYPVVNADTRTVQVRILVANPDGQLRVGQYADVSIHVPVSGSAVLAIADSAIMDDGTRQVAFLALPNGVFQPRKLALGARVGGYAEIRSGLSEGDRIVTSGNFLIDAESNLQTALQTFTPPGASK
jgi:membrane fusion protein, copper/silver efflux system